MHVTVYLYRCTNKTCREETKVKAFENEGIPPVLNCLRCNNGRGIKTEDLLRTKTGVLPVLHPNGSLTIVEEYDTPNYEKLRQIAGPGHGRVVVK